MSHTQVQQFFEAYRDCFNRLDGDAVADLWHVQSGIAHAARGKDVAAYTAWTTDAPMRANMQALCAAYRDNGYSRAEFVVDRCEPMGVNHAFAVVRWTLRRHDGSIMQQFKTGYNLIRTELGPRVVLATQFEEDIERMNGDATH